MACEGTKCAGLEPTKAGLPVYLNSDGEWIPFQKFDPSTIKIMSILDLVLIDCAHEKHCGCRLWHDCGPSTDPRVLERTHREHEEAMYE